MYFSFQKNKNILYYVLFINILCLFSNSLPALSSQKEDDIDQLISGIQKLAKIDFNISRQQNRGLYFSEEATLKFSNVVINYKNQHDHLKAVDDFLVEEVKANKKNGWSKNHLAADLFVVVNDTRTEIQKCIKGTLLAEESGEVGSLFYDFSINPDNKNINNKAFANFVSSEVKGDVLQFVKDRNYVPITKSTLRPIFDKESNHGDRLACDTISTNIDLFFSLINKSAHREDLSILSMGVRYYSSYDACDKCFTKVYNMQNSIQPNLEAYANRGGYKYVEKIPFYTVFHSSRPYQKTSYNLKLQETDEPYIVSPKNIFPLYKIEHHPNFSFDLNISGTLHEGKLKENTSFGLNLRKGEIDLVPNIFYLSVSDFDKKQAKFKIF